MSVRFRESQTFL